MLYLLFFVGGIVALVYAGGISSLLAGAERTLVDRRGRPADLSVQGVIPAAGLLLLIQGWWRSFAVRSA